MAEINTTYDISKALRAIEEELIASMIRNIDHHRAEETKEGYLWSQWQVEQLRRLEEYKALNARKYNNTFKSINSTIDALIKAQREAGNAEQEIEILKAIKKGAKFKRTSGTIKMSAGFFKINDRKINALINATVNDVKKGETAILRMSNDKYRQIIYNAQIYAASGSTYKQAVDMATKDFLRAGINCIEYKNGSRHTLSEYADMAIKTAQTRAYLAGEGEKRIEWGISTVILNKRGDNPCPKCVPFVGKVMIDDVWSGGSSRDGPYPLISSAIAKGLYHPRCKDMHTTYFPGISTPPDSEFTKEEIQELEDRSDKETKQQYAKRQAEKYDRMSKYSLDESNKKMYKTKANKWKEKSETNHEKTDSIIKYTDVTEQWLKSETNKLPTVKDLHEYTVDGVTYKVDGKNVKLIYSEKEKEIADLISSKLDWNVEMIPVILKPDNIKTPDYIINGKRYDLKELKGSSKDLVYNALHKKKKQADNFILDLSGNEKITETDVVEQIKRIFERKNTEFVQTIILVKDKDIKKIFTKVKK